MWMDIVIAIIFVFSTAIGYRTGFVRSFFHAAGWLLSIVLAFVWFPQIELFLREKTDYYESIHKTILDKLTASSAETTDPITEGLPTVLQNVIESAEDAMTSALADGFAGFLFNVISFLLVVLAVRLVFLLLASLLGKKHQDGVIGFVDGVLGLASGALKGILLIFFLLALLVPVITLSGGDFLTESLTASKIAGPLYDNNLILLIIKGSL